MRFMVLFLFLTSASSVLAQQTPAQESPKLKRLREDFQKRRTTSQKEWRDEYVRALKTLQDEYTKAADLDAALGVRNEIQRISERIDDNRKALEQRLAGAPF